MAGHPHRAFWRIPPHSFSSHLDGCLSSQLGHRALQNERGCLSSHQAQCGNPPVLVDSCWWAEHIACWTGLFLVWEPTLDTHTSSASSSLVEGGPSCGRCHPLPRDLLPHLTPPREADALVLGPRFRLSSSQWPGPASAGRPTSLGKEPKPWAFSRPRDLPAVLRLHCVPLTLVTRLNVTHVWSGRPHTHSSILTPPPPPPPWAVYNVPTWKRLQVSLWLSMEIWESRTHPCVRDLPGEMRVDEGQGQVWAPALQWFPGLQQVRHQRANSHSPSPYFTRVRSLFLWRVVRVIVKSQGFKDLNFSLFPPHAEGTGLIPGQGTKILHAMWCGWTRDGEKERWTGAWIQEPASWIQVLILSLTSSEILDPLVEFSLPQFPQYKEDYQEFVLSRVFQE